MRTPLRHLALFVTESCNLACTYCYATGREGKHIDPALAETALAFALSRDNPSPAVTITFWGGEPLLRFDTLTHLVETGETLARRHAKRVHFALPTNVTLLEAEHIAFFQAHDVQLSLSLDGGPRAQGFRQTHRGESSFPTILAKLELLARHYGAKLPPVRVTVSPATVSDFVENIQFLLDSGFHRIYFAPVVEAFDSEALEAFETGQSALVDVWVDRLRQGRRTGFHTWDRALTALRLERLGRLDKDPPLPCSAGTAMLAVDIHGRFYPCHRFVFYDKPDHALSLGTLDAGEPNPTARGRYQALTRSRFASSRQACRDCPLATRCFQMCPALNAALHQDITQVDDRLCRLAQIERRIIDKIDRETSRVPELERYVAGLEARALTRRSSGEPSHWYHQANDITVETIVRKAEQVLSRMGRVRPFREGTDDG